MPASIISSKFALANEPYSVCMAATEAFISSPRRSWQLSTKCTVLCYSQKRQYAQWVKVPAPGYHTTRFAAFCVRSAHTCHPQPLSKAAYIGPKHLTRASWSGQVPQKPQGQHAHAPAALTVSATSAAKSFCSVSSPSPTCTRTKLPTPSLAPPAALPAAASTSDTCSAEKTRAYGSAQIELTAIPSLFITLPPAWIAG